MTPGKQESFWPEEPVSAETYFEIITSVAFTTAVTSSPLAPDWFGKEAAKAMTQTRLRLLFLLFCVIASIAELACSERTSQRVSSEGSSGQKITRSRSQRSQT